MKIKQKNIIILFLFLFLNFNYILAEDTKDTTTEPIDNELYFLFTICYPMGSNSPDFFEFYRNELSGVSKEFKLSPIFTFGLVFDLTDFSSILLIAELNRAVINDSYNEIISSGHAGVRNITQNFDIFSLPITFNYKYHPILSNYFTYLMIGLGVAYTRIKWEESVFSTIQDDIRKGGLHYNKSIFFPYLKLTSGIELEFDQKKDNNFLRSFFFEFSFNFFFRSADIFSKVEEQFYNRKEGFERHYTILPFYFGLNLGLYFSLNFVN